MEKAHKGFWQVLKFIFPYFGKLKSSALILRTALSLCFVIITILINGLAPLFFKKVVDLMYASDIDSSSQWIVIMLFSYGGIWTVSQITGQVRELVSVPVFTRILRIITLDIVKHLFSLSMRFHAFKQTGAVISAINLAQDAVPRILYGVLFCFFPVFAEISIAALVITYNYGFAFGMIIVVLFLVYFLFTLYNSRQVLEAQKNFNEARMREMGKGTDTLINIETVKYFGKTEFEMHRYDDCLKVREETEIKFFTTLEILHLIQAIIIGGGLSFIIVLSGLNVLSGKFTISDFVMINTYVLQFVTPFLVLGKVIRDVRKGVSNMQNAMKILDIRPEIKEPDNQVDIQGSSVGVEFRNVDFGYFSDVKILRDLSLKIPEKKMTAIVGSTGSGKSTITKLLFRFYDVLSGEILLNGINLKKFSLSCITRSFGIVPQSVAMFNESLRYNIAYGKPSATDDEIWEAIKVAQLQNFMRDLPSGLDAKIGEHGARMSGGERQRLAIARAVLKKPKLFIFDEATSALDTKTERAIQQSLVNISKDITTLVIAHRLSTVIHADQIIVLDEGQVVETGTHDQLLVKQGVYAKLWEEQFAGE